MTTLVIGQNYWGHGETVQEAKTNWRKQHGGSRKLRDGYAVVEFPPELEFAGVDSIFGDVSWRDPESTGVEPTVTEFPPK